MSPKSRLKKTLIGSGARRDFILSAIDTVDGLWLRLTHQDMIPPFSLRRHVTRVSDFFHVVDEYIAYFKLIGGLRMDDTVLDIGCACGRFAVRLIDIPHFFHGEYHGFDPHRKSILWAQQHVQNKFPNLHFEVIDLHSGHYNPGGTVNPENLRFPYRDNYFDFVFAWSVFTHMFPSSISNYLHEINRVLKPGKRAIVTCLILDGYPRTLDLELALLRNLVRKNPELLTARWHHNGDYSFLDPDHPEAVVALQRSWIERTARDAHLEVEEIRYGSWNHRHDYLSEQDFLVLRKGD